jgi:hypothetical protein
MSTTIKPTVGRVVWFYPAANQATNGFHPPTLNDPLAAIVAKVIGDSTLNLTVFDAQGFSHSMTDVPLIQAHEGAPVDGYFATWMPYQIGQAKKAEDREHDAKQLAVAADRASDERRVRAGVLDMALRTPGLSNHSEVLAAALAYQEHIEGEKTLPAPLERTAPGPLFPGYSSMLPHQQRVVDEKCELDARLAKLRPFFDTPTFAGLDEEEKQRLVHQEAAMQEYSTILGERIVAFVAAAA